MISLGSAAGWLLCGLLICVIFSDLRHMRIPNGFVVALVGVWLALVLPDLSLAEAGWRLLAAALLFALGLAAFAARALGGGDVKLLAALILFVPSYGLVLFTLFLSAGLVLSLLAVGLWRRFAPVPTPGWDGLSPQRRYPLGPGIGIAGISFVALAPQVATYF